MHISRLLTQVLFSFLRKCELSVEVTLQRVAEEPILAFVSVLAPDFEARLPALVIGEQILTKFLQVLSLCILHVSITLVAPVPVYDGESLELKILEAHSLFSVTQESCLGTWVEAEELFDVSADHSPHGFPFNVDELRVALIHSKLLQVELGHATHRRLTVLLLSLSVGRLFRSAQAARWLAPLLHHDLFPFVQVVG